MKKYLFIAATSILFVACTKVDTNPVTQPNSNASQAATVTPAASVAPVTPPVAARVTSIITPDNCYTIRNTEKAAGVVEYRIAYTDCDGVDQDIALPFGQSLSICSKTGVVKTNFANSMIDCFQPPNIPCENYSITNLHGPTGMTITYEYNDCDGKHQSGFINPLSTIYISAFPGSVHCSGGEVKSN